MPETTEQHPCAFCGTPTRYLDGGRKAHICITCLARLSSPPAPVSFYPVNVPYFVQPTTPEIWKVWCSTAAPHGGPTA